MNEPRESWEHYAERLAQEARRRAREELAELVRAVIKEAVQVEGGTQCAARIHALLARWEVVEQDV